MNRRKFFSKLIIATISIPIVNILGSSSKGQSQQILRANDLDYFNRKKMDNRIFIVKREFTSAIHPNRTYKNSSEFWQDHSIEENMGERINSQLNKSNRLLKTKSFLKRDGKTVINYKVYRSKKDHEEFKRLLTKLSPNPKIKVRNI